MNKKQIGLWTGIIIGVLYAMWVGSIVGMLPPVRLSIPIADFIDTAFFVVTFSNVVLASLFLRLFIRHTYITALIYEASSMLYFGILGVLVDRLRTRFSKSQVFFILLGFMVVNIALIFIIPRIFGVFGERFFDSVFMGGVPPLLRKNFTGSR